MYIFELVPIKPLNDPCWKSSGWKERIMVVACSEQRARDLVSIKLSEASEVVSAYGNTPPSSPWQSPECASCKKLRDNNENLPEGVIE